MKSLGNLRLAGSQKPEFLQDNEEVIVASKIHWAIFWKAAGVFLIGLWFLTFAFNLGVFLIFVSSVMGAIAYLTKRFLMLVLTNKRVIVRAGIVYAEVIQLRFSQIESVELAYTLIGQFLGYADVVLSGTGQRIMIVPFVANATEFRKTLDQMLLDRDERQYGAYAQAPVQNQNNEGNDQS